MTRALPDTFVAGFIHAHLPSNIAKLGVDIEAGLLVILSAMAKTKITLALGSYDRHAPLLEGCIEHPTFAVQYIELDPQQGRHERFLQHFEFDACELSLSSYSIAVDQGMPVHAVPIFPRRLFSQSQMYKNINCGIDSPKDLAGKKIGLS
ncbi:MAG: hypothetical protein ACREO5_14160, partial [Candidatus Binatia bacterium]